MKKWISAILIVAAISSGSALHASAGNSILTEINRIERFQADSEDALAVAQWLRNREAYVEGQLGDIVVIRSKSHAGLYQPQSPGDAPPVGLPAFGSPGEEITIESTRGGAFQTWSYRWTGTAVRGSWVLIRYQYSNTLPK